MKSDCMLEILDNMVDVQKLKQSQELRTPIEDEAKRQSIDAAKKRAALQNVDYPCFAALVSCAHLKPMKQKELDSTMEVTNWRYKSQSIPAWSFDVSGHLQTDMSNLNTCKHMNPTDGACTVAKSDNPRKEAFIPKNGSHISLSKNSLLGADEISAPSLSKLAVTTIFGVPQASSQQKKIHASVNPQRITRPSEHERLVCSSDSFIKEWKLLNALPPSERLRFLRQFLPSNLQVIFRVEIPPFLLGEILETLHKTTIIPDRGVDQRDTDANLVGYNQLDAKKVSDCSSRSSSSSVHVKEMRVEGIINDSTSDLMEQPKQKQEAMLVPNDETDDDNNLMDWVILVMDALRRCGRFSLAVKLIGQESRQTAREIIDYISNTIRDPQLFARLTCGAQPLDLLVSYND